MTQATPVLGGIHHVTAIVDNAQQNVDFYHEVLGLRLVKRTINFDDPYTYHLYYGDENGTPGTIVTFFPWEGGRHGSQGSGMLSAMSFSVPAGSLAYWQARIAGYGLRQSAIGSRMGERNLELYDPSGLLLELVESDAGVRGVAPRNSDVAAKHAIRGLAGVTLTVAEAEPTAALLQDVLGFRAGLTEANRTRYLLGHEPTAARLDLLLRNGLPRGQVRAGSIHHVAWRVADDASQLAWRERLEQAGVQVTPVRDRKYFHSIYFQEPAGATFEIATDSPGFAIDESAAQLGTELQLPPWLEEQRADIERHLPPITNTA